MDTLGNLITISLFTVIILGSGIGITISSITLYRVDGFSTLLNLFSTDGAAILGDNSDLGTTLQPSLVDIPDKTNSSILHQLFPECPDEVKCSVADDCRSLWVTDMRQYQSHWIDGVDIQQLTTECHTGQCFYYFYVKFNISGTDTLYKLGMQNVRFVYPTGDLDPGALNDSRVFRVWTTASTRNQWDDVLTGVCRSWVHPENRTLLHSVLLYVGSAATTFETACYYGYDCDAGLMPNSPYVTSGF